MNDENNLLFFGINIDNIRDEQFRTVVENIKNYIIDLTGECFIYVKKAGEEEAKNE